MSGELETNFGGNNNNPLLPPPQISVAAEVDGDKGKEKPESASIDVSKLQIQHSIKELIDEIRQDHRQATRLITLIGVFMTLATLLLAAAIVFHGFWTEKK